ncbi:MAG: MFS transporter [Smithellaceae bacterium]|jgi:EmrB/QacA subfamily drug resistance transporter
MTADKKQLSIVLCATTLSAFITPFMGSSVNVALPVMAQDLSMTALTLSWVPSSFLLAAAITLVPLGRLADICGRKKFFFWGAIIFTLASLLCSWSPTATFLILARIIQGIGGAMIFSTGTAILVAAFPVRERGGILGINIAAVYVGLTIGPFVGGLLTEQLGWRCIFLFTALFGFMMLLLILFMAKEEWQSANGEHFDFTGSLLYAIALFAVMYGFSLLPDLQAGGLILFGIVCLFFFIRHQLRVPYPLLNIHLFRDNRVFAFSNLAALINYCATFAVTFLLSLYLQHIQALTPLQAGMILIAEPAVQASFSPLAGRLSDRFEPGIIASIGMALNVAGLIPLMFINFATSISYIVFCLIVLGLGFALFSSPNVNAAMSAVENKYYGIASATLATMRMIGQMFSMGITMLVFAVFLGDRPLDQAGGLLLQSIQLIFFILGILCCAGIFASLARGKIHK